ncbi:unnamed protein product [Bemisia tabaci]|uniref:Nose resistant-to-fluoxetine protein N-terminal domain-containing protein n=1 Tax=Bemisia tabaci TaxID=7038 RepID=A0A9P0A840_BEMTA|nr:unnamed protein product [Bemisia tabaci]
MIGFNPITLPAIFLFALSVTGQVNKEQEYEKSFLQGVFHMSPALSVSGKNLSPQCKIDFQEFTRDLQQLKYWAFQMHDSTGKPNSGMLNGNLHSYGDYEQCLAVSHPRVKGKYCLLGFDVDFHPKSTYRGNVRHLLEGAYADYVWYGPNHNAPGGRSPPQRKILWGFCIPASCDVDDLQNGLRQILAPFNSTDHGLEIRMFTMGDSCTTEESKSFTARSYFVMALIGGFFALTLFSTYYDMSRQSSTGVLVDVHKLNLPMKIALAFSLKRTVPYLLDCRTKNDGSDVSCVNGIRCIYAIQIYIGHKMLFTFFYPVINRTAIMRQLMGHDYSMFFGATLNSIDTFVLMSGLLVSFNGFQQLSAGRSFNIPLMYLKRYMKFMPLYLMIVLVIRDIFPYILRNPHNISLLDERYQHCENIWKTLTYTSNVDSLNEMCHPVSHQVVTDYQMYLLSPFLVLFLWHYKATAFKVVSLAMAAICVYSGWVIYSKNLVAVAYHGIAFDLAIESVDHMYLNPIHRLPPYIVGVLLGYVLHHYKTRPIKLSQLQLILGHILAAIAAYYSYFWLWRCAKKGYQYNAMEMAIYKAVHPFLWGFVLCWIIFICYTGQTKTLNKYLSLTPFVFFSKISYAFYIYQAVDITLQLHVQRLPTYLHPLNVMDTAPLGKILFHSILFTLIFCLPVNLIEKHLKSPKGKNS